MDDSLFKDRLLSGERIEWRGRPGNGVFFTPRDAFLIPFSILWCGFAIVWEFGVIVSKAPPFFLAFGAIFVVIGLFFVFGRFFVDAWLRGGTHYAITDRRVLMARLGPLRGFTALSRSQIPQTRLSERRGGRGTIRFGADAPMWGASGFSFWTPSLDSTPQFIDIEDAGRVFDLIQKSKAS